MGYVTRMDEFCYMCEGLGVRMERDDAGDGVGDGTYVDESCHTCK